MNTENLKAARKNSGKTQKEVADSLGVGQSTYKNYECGLREPNGDTVVALANLFGVTTDYLLGRPDAKPLEDLKEGDTVHWYETLKMLREDSGESMSKTAEAVGIPKGTYASYEYGKREPNIEMISKISQHFGVTTDYLLGRPGAKPEDLVQATAKRYGLTSAQRGILAAYVYMDDTDREALVKSIRGIAAGAEKAEAGEHAAESPPQTQPQSTKRVQFNVAARSSIPGNRPHAEDIPEDAELELQGEPRTKDE